MNFFAASQVNSFQSFKDSISRSTPVPLIRFITLESFKQLDQFPRYPDNKDITISLDDIDERTYNESLFIFISHRWLRGSNKDDGWDGRPHPDNAMKGKYALCVEGINKIQETLTQGIKECYVWIDYGCINQDEAPADELKYLNLIVQVCDLLFTPIYDANHNLWEFPTTLSPRGFYEDYNSPAWKSGEHGYLNRGWCRIEMFYGSNIPLIEDAPERRSRMKSGLKIHRSCGRRPHVLYGSKQQAKLLPLIVIPPLQNIFFEEYNPTKGFVSNASDHEKIKVLVAELQPFMKPITENYEGMRDESGKMHGQGRYDYENGDVYLGDWKHGKKCGKGMYTSSCGDKYEGDWQDDHMYGEGKLTFANGDVYDGDWKMGEMDGHGRYSYDSGGYYLGNFCRDKKNGRGKDVDANNNKYEGEWRENMKHGHGKLEYANGSVYEGDWEGDKKHGEGKMIDTSGNTYIGNWRDDKKDGMGKCIFTGGKVYEGEWRNDDRDGNGKTTYPDGRIFEGTYKEGKKEGKGSLKAVNGDVYEGEWANDKMIDDTTPAGLNGSNISKEQCNNFTHAFQNQAAAGKAPIPRSHQASVADFLNNSTVPSLSNRSHGITRGCYAAIMRHFPSKNKVVVINSSSNDIIEAKVSKNSSFFQSEDFFRIYPGKDEDWKRDRKDGEVEITINFQMKQYKYSKTPPVAIEVRDTGIILLSDNYDFSK